MTRWQKIILWIAMLRPRPTSSRPLEQDILLSYGFDPIENGHNRTTATSSHVVSTSSHAGGRPQQGARPSSPSPSGDELPEMSKTHTRPSSSRDDLRDDLEPTFGQCTACGSVEVALVHPTGTRDLTDIGESPTYPTGHGCEVCA